jgi:transposase
LEILVLKKKGLTQRQIARKLGISRNTVKKYIENQGYPESDRSKPNRKSLLDRFQGNLAAWLEEDMEYRATWIYDKLRPMGFAGSYEIVKRAVHDIKAARQRIAYMRFETEPGYQSQVDFGEFQFDRADGTIGKIYLFSMILGFSRRIYSRLRPFRGCD